MTFSKECKRRVREQIEWAMAGPIAGAGLMTATQEDHALMVRVRDQLPRIIEDVARESNPTPEGAR